MQLHEVSKISDFGIPVDEERCRQLMVQPPAAPDLEAKRERDYYDRSDLGIWDAFRPLDGKGVVGTLHEKAALLRRPVRVLDYGDTTGNQLTSMIAKGTRVPPHPGIDLDKVEATLLSQRDLSSQAASWRVRAALGLGVFKHVIGDYNDLDRKKPGFDIIYAYDALYNAVDPAEMAVSLVRCLSQGGSLYINADPKDSDMLLRAAQSLNLPSAPLVTSFLQQSVVTTFWRHTTGYPRPWPQDLEPPFSMKLQRLKTR